MSRIKKFTFIILGLLFTCIGIVGIFVPILPTTPFLLLAAFLFSKSSDRFLHWLCTNPLCGKYIDNYRNGLGISLQQKIVSLVVLWMSIGLSAFVFVDKLWIKILLFGVAVAVTLHLILIKTYQSPPEEIKEEKLEIHPKLE